MAVRLDMEIEFSQRDTNDFKSEEFVVKLHPRNTTYEIIDRWKEIDNLGINFPFPEEEINNLDWKGITQFINKNSRVMKDDKIYEGIDDYIFSNSLTEDLKIMLEKGREVNDNEK